MPAYLATVTYSAIVFGDDEADAREAAPRVIRSLENWPVCIEVEPMNEPSAPGTSPGPTNAGAQQQ